MDTVADRIAGHLSSHQGHTPMLLSITAVTNYPDGTDSGDIRMRVTPLLFFQWLCHVLVRKDENKITSIVITIA